MKENVIFVVVVVVVSRLSSKTRAAFTDPSLLAVFRVIAIISS